MAETDDYPSTPLRLLLRDFLALIVEHSKLSEPAAKQLILDYYAEAERPFGYRYQSVATPFGRSGQGIDPRHWRGSAEAERWGIHVEVDWQNNWVTKVRTAPDADITPETRLGVLGHLREYLPADPVCQMRLVRLYTRDAFAILRWAGLLPPADIPAAAAAKADAVTPAPVKLPRGETERWVYEHMKADPPHGGDHEYVANTHERCPYPVKQKTIANLVGRYRERFEIPAEAPARPPQSSRGKVKSSRGKGAKR